MPTPPSLTCLFSEAMIGWRGLISIVFGDAICDALFEEGERSSVLSEKRLPLCLSLAWAVCRPCEASHAPSLSLSPHQKRMPSLTCSGR